MKGETQIPVKTFMKPVFVSPSSEKPGGETRSIYEKGSQPKRVVFFI